MVVGSVFVSSSNLIDVTCMYLSAVCTLVNREKELTITAREGESVLLPCSCTDRIASEEFTWKKLNTNRYTWEDISNESDQYRNRVQLFNNLSPANLSLLISHLTEEDDGEYRCDAKGSGYIKIRLTVRGRPYTVTNNIHTFLD
uniref:Ig-like domain-containing protein n=1 Tax=Astyanax mexicanus TaxID=7994 RepID=A0A8B9HXW7_ASTMX